MADVTPEAGGSSRGLTPEQLAADTADLRASLAALARLVTGSQGLHELLERVATFAANAIPGADGAGVTLLKVDGAAHRVEGLAASHPFVREIDEIQYVTVKEGPCITAVLEGRTVRAGSLAAERMWPRFGPRVGRLGVHSALSLPLVLPPGETVGAINVYAHCKNAFGEHAAHLGELFATSAAVAVHNAHLLTKAHALAAQPEGAEYPTYHRPGHRLVARPHWSYRGRSIRPASPDEPVRTRETRRSRAAHRRRSRPAGSGTAQLILTTGPGSASRRPTVSRT
jgi:hypothetical protein